MVAMAPLAIDQSGDYSDSSATRFGIAAGAGSYGVVTRGCQGEVLSKYKRDFHDVAATLEHEFRGPLVLGVRGQQVSAPGGDSAGSEVDQFLWNPHAGLEWRSFGIGAGYVTPHGERLPIGPLDFDIPPVSAHLRFGNPRRTDFSLRLMEGAPYASSGGVFEARFGMRVSSAVRGWIGLGSPEPFDGAGLIAGTDIRLARGLRVDVGGRLGGSEGINESAVRAGVSYTWTHRRYDPRSESLPPDTRSATLTLTLDGGDTLSAVSIEPWSMGYVRVVLANGQTSFLSTAKIRTVVGPGGADLTDKVLKERRRVP
jgi:hypothetical protein